MIIKINQDQLNEVLSGILVPATSSYFVGNFGEKLSVGKVTFSVKVGKNRKLLTGKIIHAGYFPSRTSSGHNILRFIPNNYEKFKSLEFQQLRYCNDMVDLSVLMWLIGVF